MVLNSHPETNKEQHPTSIDMYILVDNFAVELKLALR